MKRWFFILIAVFLMLTGCSAAEPLTPEEYGKTLSAVWREWAGNTTSVTMLIPADTEAPDFLDTISENHPKAQEYFKTLEKCYDDFESIVPPQEYAELHEQLLSGVKHERTWLKYLKQMFEADNVEAFNAASDRLIAHVNEPDHTSLPKAYVDIYMQLKDEGYDIVVGGA